MTMPGYELTADAPRRLLRVVMSGHWDMDILRGYALDRAAAIRSLEAAGVAEAELRILVDRRSQSVQSQEVTSALADMLTEFEPRTRKSAVLVSGALQRLQAARISTTEHTCIFSDEAEAMNWLLSDQEGTQ